MSDTAEPGEEPEWYRRVVETSNVVTMALAPGGTATYVSPPVERVLGYEAGDVVGSAIVEYAHPEDREAVETAIETVEANPGGRRDVEVRLRRRDGSWCWVAATLRNHLDDQSIGSVVLEGREITERTERTAELRTTKERMEMALEGANLGIWDWDMETDEVERDELLTEMLGYTPSEMGDHLRDWEAVVHPEGKERHDQALADHVENRTPYYECEYRLETDAGDWKWVKTIGKVVDRDADGTPVRAVGIHQDVDDRKRAEMALAEERDIFRDGPAVVLEWKDTDEWPVTYTSGNVEDIFGYQSERLRSGEITFADVVHEDDLESLRRAVDEHDWSQGERFHPEPYRVITADGETRWVMEFTEKLDGDRLLGYLVDITERKEREFELRQYKAAVDRSAHAIYITDRDGTIEYVNPAFESVTGYSESDAVGETPRILQSGEYGEEYYEEFWETVLTGDQWEAEMIDERADGETMVLDQTVAPITDEQGEVRKFVAVARDVSDRIAYEEALEAARAELRQVVDLIPDLIFAWNRDGEFLLANEQTAELFGVDSEALEGTSPSGEQDLPARFEAFRDDAGAVIDADESAVLTETEVTTDDGETRIVQTNMIPFETAETGTDAVLTYARDVTELKRRERELRARERKYRNLFEDSRDALMLLDRDGFSDCNERALELFGVDSVDTFADHSPWEFAPATQPDGTDSEETALARIEEAFEDGGAFFEFTHQRVDGTAFPAEVKLSRFDQEDGPALHALVRDITDRKEYERRIEEQRDDLEVLNQVLRHDIRNDLQLVTASAELLSERCDDDVAEHIETIRTNADHAVELTTSAREMANVMLSAEKDLEHVSLPKVLAGELEEVRSAYAKAVVTRETTIPPVPVQGNEMLGSVFRNLLKNAIQHNDAAVPKVAVSAAQHDERVVVRVADNGPGVPKGQREAIFGKGEKGLDSTGTGIGLYLVKTLVESYGGDIWVEDRDSSSDPLGVADDDLSDSGDGSGAVFVVELPVAE